MWHSQQKNRNSIYAAASGFWFAWQHLQIIYGIDQRQRERLSSFKIERIERKNRVVLLSFWAILRRAIDHIIKNLYNDDSDVPEYIIEWRENGSSQRWMWKKNTRFI